VVLAAYHVLKQQSDDQVEALRTAVAPISLPASTLPQLTQAPNAVTIEGENVLARDGAGRRVIVGGANGTDGVEIQASLFDCLLATVLSGDLVVNLSDTSPEMVEAIVGATLPQLARAAREGSLAMLRRLSEGMAEPPLVWVQMTNHAYEQALSLGIEDFVGLWHQNRIEVAQANPVPNEPIFTLALVEQALGILPDFDLRPTALPVASLYEWNSAGGDGLQPHHLGVRAVTTLQTTFIAQWAGTCATSASLAIGRELIGLT
jgi:hypothetical protein